MCERERERGGEVNRGEREGERGERGGRERERLRGGGRVANSGLSRCFSSAIIMLS